LNYVSPIEAINNLSGHNTKARASSAGVVRLGRGFNPTERSQPR
jgi:hypothetical protein